MIFYILDNWLRKIIKIKKKIFLKNENKSHQYSIFGFLNFSQIKESKTL